MKPVIGRSVGARNIGAMPLSVPTYRAALRNAGLVKLEKTKLLIRQSRLVARVHDPVAPTSYYFIRICDVTKLFVGIQL